MYEMYFSLVKYYKHILVEIQISTNIHANSWLWLIQFADIPMTVSYHDEWVNVVPSCFD